MTETSTRPVALHSYLAYRDAPAALRFLEEAFGFTTTMQVPDEQGGIAHSELRLGDVAVVVFSDYDQYDRPQPKGDTVGFGLYVSVEQAAEVDAYFARAVSAGASPVWEPAMSEWGDHPRRCGEAHSSMRSGRSRRASRCSIRPSPDGC
ncbi:MAG: glyoxalase [Geodermatophilaceae bacterium]|nr:glyoxalase [Geodermatophilaceae bacterium]MDQ3454790.1 glyoxalase [Actinomycetota bacterium]